MHKALQRRRSNLVYVVYPSRSICTTREILPQNLPEAPRSLLAEGLEADALDGPERLLAGGRDGLAEHELRDERPRLREVPRREHLRRDERVVVLQRRAEALRLERGPNDVLQDAL